MLIEGRREQYYMYVEWSYFLTIQNFRKMNRLRIHCEIVEKSSSHTWLAAPEVVDRGLAESVLKPSIEKYFFCLTQA